MWKSNSLGAYKMMKGVSVKRPIHQRQVSVPRSGPGKLGIFYTSRSRHCRYGTMIGWIKRLKRRETQASRVDHRWYKGTYLQRMRCLHGRRTTLISPSKHILHKIFSWTVHWNKKTRFRWMCSCSQKLFTIAKDWTIQNINEGLFQLLDFF